MDVFNEKIIEDKKLKLVFSKTNSVLLFTDDNEYKRIKKMVQDALESKNLSKQQIKSVTSSILDKVMTNVTHTILGKSKDWQTDNTTLKTKFYLFNIEDLNSIIQNFVTEAEREYIKQKVKKEQNALKKKTKVVATIKEEEKLPENITEIDDIVNWILGKEIDQTKPEIQEQSVEYTSKRGAGNTFDSGKPLDNSSLSSFKPELSSITNVDEDSSMIDELSKLNFTTNHVTNNSNNSISINPIKQSIEKNVTPKYQNKEYKIPIARDGKNFQHYLMVVLDMSKIASKVTESEIEAIYSICKMAELNGAENADCSKNACLTYDGHVDFIKIKCPEHRIFGKFDEKG